MATIYVENSASFCNSSVLGPVLTNHEMSGISLFIITKISGKFGFPEGSVYRVVIEGCLSGLLDINDGVSQGSVFSAKLFLLLINDH